MPNRFLFVRRRRSISAQKPDRAFTICAPLRTTVYAAAMLALSLCAHAFVPFQDVSAISVGPLHACALTSSGGVKCWGGNSDGQLGDNSTSRRLTPVGVNGLSGNVVAVTVGRSHTCALTASGGVKCWGANFRGQLGNGSFDASLTPVDVTGLTSGVVAIDAGDLHTCALLSTGGVKCWGDGDDGRLGDGSDVDRPVPVNVVGLPGGNIAVSAGGSHTCAITTGVGLRCWGNNRNGQLGDNTTSASAVPVTVLGLGSDATGVSAGASHTCAVLQGGLKCWGSNNTGQLGDNSRITRLVPVDVTGLLAGAIAVTAGSGQTCAITASGSAHCWGTNTSGQLGDGTTVTRLVPAEVSGLADGVTAISTAEGRTCAITTGASAQCWGSNELGELGDNATSIRPFPVDVVGLGFEVESIDAGDFHTCALLNAGSVKCWGGNGTSQLGDGSSILRTTPVGVLGLGAGVSVTSAGDMHSCAVTAAGGAMCWGWNSSGQLGDNSTIRRTVPVPVFGLSSGLVAIVAGGAHSCAITTGGGAKCWGNNDGGQLGDNTTTRRLAPVDVSGLGSGIASLALGAFHTCALTSNGGVMCWGLNSSGQLGDGSRTNRSIPVGVIGLSSGVAAISAGFDHTCALTTDGAVKCWGSNAQGELGDGSGMGDQLTPVDVTGLSRGAASVSAGQGHSCAVTSHGAVKCWGENGSYQLGDGTASRRDVPVDVVGLMEPIVDVALGSKHSCALAVSGAVKCWGDSYFGQIGDGSEGIRRYPAPVLYPSHEISVAIVGPGAGSVLSSRLGIDCPGTCRAHFAEGAVVQLTASPAAGSAFVGWSGACTGSSLVCTMSVNSPASTIATFEPQPAVISLDNASLDFGAQAMGTSSPALAVTVTNAGYSPLLVYGVVLDNQQFAQTNDCAVIQPSQTCTLSVVFSPAVGDGPVNSTVQVSGSLLLSSNAGDREIRIQGVAEKSLSIHYYRSILGRLPDAGGRAFWAAEAVRSVSLGINVNETWFAMAQAFYGSPEYASRVRNDESFVRDLYRTFFNRPADDEGLAYWRGLLTEGLPRGVMLASFMFSPEFTGFSRAIFGEGSSRPEVDTVVDFYRGLLGRLPDDSGFIFWLGRFRRAQCSGSAAVISEAEAISSAFANSPEYYGRTRSDPEHVSDLYNSFLRRGGDLGGVQFWQGQLSSGRSREDLRRAFLASPEFDARVRAMVAACCVI